MLVSWRFTTKTNLDGQGLPLVVHVTTGKVNDSMTLEQTDE
ncbi:hypothetical protein OHR68_35905 [Spirillospora sp. NBC_00431]